MNFEKKVKLKSGSTKRIDVYIPSAKVMIEQKSLDIDLDKPKKGHDGQTPFSYQNNPTFKKYIADNGLDFKAYDQFGKAEIPERNTLLVQLVKMVWNDNMFI